MSEDHKMHGFLFFIEKKFKILFQINFRKITKCMDFNKFQNHKCMDFNKFETDHYGLLLIN